MTIELFVENPTLSEELQNYLERASLPASSIGSIQEVVGRIQAGARAFILEAEVLDPDDVAQLKRALAALPENEHPSVGFVIEQPGLPEVAIPLLRVCRFVLLPGKFLSNALPAFVAHLATQAPEQRNTASSREAGGSVSLKCMAQMCHDLRTPLTAIQGYVELIEESAPGAMSDVKQPLLQNCKAIETIITSAIEMSHITLSGEAMDLGPVDLRDLFAALRNQFSLDSQRKGLKLVLAAGADAVVLGEKKALHRVLSNLLCNALKFTDSGTVSVSVAAGEQKASIFVEDSGPGVPKDFLDKMFQPFERADASSSTIGTGLGLSIARQLVGLMGGSIRGENRKDGGMRFTVILLRANEALKTFAEASRREDLVTQ